MSDEPNPDEFSDQLDFLRETKDVIEDLSQYAVAKASMTPEVLNWVEKVSTMAAEYRASRTVGFSEDQSMAFLYARHLSGGVG